MKKFWAMNLLPSEPVKGIAVHLASDIDRLRTEGRERVARHLRDIHGGYLYDEMDPQYVEAESLTDADGILSAFFDEEGKHEGN